MTSLFLFIGHIMHDCGWQGGTNTHCDRALHTWMLEAWSCCNHRGTSFKNIYLEIMVDDPYKKWHWCISLRMFHNVIFYYFDWNIGLSTVGQNVTMVVNGISFGGVEPGSQCNISAPLILVTLLNLVWAEKQFFQGFNIWPRYQICY